MNNTQRIKQLIRDYLVIKKEYEELLPDKWSQVLDMCKGDEVEAVFLLSEAIVEVTK